MNMTPFWQPSFYTPLNSKTGELRLLTIRKPENQTVLIKCDTQTFELNHAPRFDALSYVWGDPSVTKEIQFCGLSRLVTGNLFEALTRLREEGDSKWIWIDALCIYSYRTATKCCRNLRFRPQFCEGFGFASHCLDSNPQKPVRAPFGSRLQSPTAPPNTFQLKPVAWKLRKTSNPSVCAMTRPA
jgi:hypothetical protein